MFGAVTRALGRRIIIKSAVAASRVVQMRFNDKVSHKTADQ